MNKTVTVNIGGIVFYIDENAYEKFKAYLEAIRGHFTVSDGRDEIMQDIEARIAEMFQDRIRDSKQVITLEDVEEVTRQMGKPEDFGGTEQEESAPSGTTAEEFKGRRRLFRNPDDKLLGGVCSGIASFFGIDPVWVRLIFAFMLFGLGTGFLLYIILWIVIPEAKNTADKLQMRGEPITVSNIQKNVKEEMDQLKNRAEDLSKDGGKKAGTAFTRLFEAIGEIIKFFFIAVGKILAVFFLFIGGIIAFTLFMSLFALAGIPGTIFPTFISHLFVSKAQFSLAYVGVVLAAGIPALMLAWAGAKNLFNIKGSRIIGFTALAFWVFGVILLLVTGLKTAREFRDKESIRRELTLGPNTGKTLILKTDLKLNEEKDYDEDDDEDWEDQDELNVKVEDGVLVSRNVRLDVVKSPTDSFQLVEILYSRGASPKEAEDNATHIVYSFSKDDSMLVFDRFFTLERDERFRFQRVQLVLKVPVGASVRFDESLRLFIYDIENIENIFDHDMLNRTWKMTENGLTCVDCDGTESVVGGGKVHINDADGSDIRIDENGLRIESSDGNSVIIDSTGIRIRNSEMDTIKVISKKGVRFSKQNSESGCSSRLAVKVT